MHPVSRLPIVHGSMSDHAINQEEFVCPGCSFVHFSLLVFSSEASCEYSVRVWNGLPAKFEGNIWNIADRSLPDTMIGLTYFQVKDPQKLVLERGKSKVIHFQIKVPADTGSLDPALCVRAFAGRGGNPFFNTVGLAHLFCIVRRPAGFDIPARDARMPAQAPGQITAQGLDVEPNNSCQAAQEIGVGLMPFSMDGHLTSPETPDVDFYRFSATPREMLVIDLERADTAHGTLEDPLLGVFDSNCNLITYNDDNGVLYNSRVIMKLPEDGVLIVAATAFPDWYFVGEGGSGGTYQLTMAPFLANATISGRAVDGVSGAPLPGTALPYTYVLLARCDDGGCFYINGQGQGMMGVFTLPATSRATRLGRAIILWRSGQSNMKLRRQDSLLLVIMSSLMSEISP